MDKKTVEGIFGLEFTPLDTPSIAKSEGTPKRGAPLPEAAPVLVLGERSKVNPRDPS